MPHLAFPSYVNGFYEDCIMNKPQGRVILYAKEGSNAGFGKMDTAKDAASQLDGKMGIGAGYKAIAVTSVQDSLSIQTSYTWEENGDWVTSFETGMKEGMQNMKHLITDFYSSAEKGVNALLGILNKQLGTNFDTSTPQADQAVTNAMMRNARRKVRSAASTYKNYGSSRTYVNIPPLEFTFVAKDFEKTHLSEAWTLLTYLLPIMTDSDGKAVSAESTEARVVYESPPNKYVNPATGFSDQNIEGVFALDIDGTKIVNLLPLSVALIRSRAKLISKDDYSITAPNLSDDGLFYSSANKMLSNIPGNTANYNSVTNVGNENFVPAVVKIQVQFDFAGAVLPETYYKMFFDGVNADQSKACDRPDKANLGYKTSTKVIYETEDVTDVSSLGNMKFW